MICLTVTKSAKEILTTSDSLYHQSNTLAHCEVGPKFKFLCTTVLLITNSMYTLECSKNTKAVRLACQISLNHLHCVNNSNSSSHCLSSQNLLPRVTHPTMVSSQITIMHLQPKCYLSKSIFK